MAYLLPENTGSLDSGTARRALMAFFLTGLLLALPGALLPAWGHHIETNFLLVAGYFFCLNVGILAAMRISLVILPKKGIGFVLLMATGISLMSLLFLGFASTQLLAREWRMLGLFGVGLAAGLSNTAVFQAIGSIYRHDAASTVNLSGIVFTMGSIVSALLVAGTFFAYNVPSILFFIAVIPALLGGLFWKTRFAPVEPMQSIPLREVLKDFKSPGAILFALLLFFQFGNEWAIAGWLPIFLIQRLGIDPSTALEMLAFYWFALLIGRTAAQAVLPRVNHARLLLGSVLASMLGCLILWATNNLQGAFVGILLIGASFAPIYPIVVSKLGSRFPYYHPGFFNGIFSVALTGGLMAPAMLGLMAHYFEVRVMIVIPLLGSMMVFLLIGLIWWEGKLHRTH